MIYNLNTAEELNVNTVEVYSAQYGAFTNVSNNVTLTLSAGAARTGNVITIPMASQLAETALDITGAATGTSGEGIIHVDVTGVLAGNAIRVDSTGANATTGQLLYLLSTGQQAGATNGICGYFEDTGAVQATSYCVYISSTNNEALKVDAGAVVFDESLTIGTTLGVTGATTLSSSCGITIADTGNVIGLTVTQNDTTNNPDAMLIDQNFNGKGLVIDSESTTNNALYVTGKYPIQAIQDIAGGYGMQVSRNIAEVGANPLVSITESDATSTQYALSVTTAGIRGVLITGNGASGTALNIDSNSNDAGTVWAVTVDSDNAGAGDGGGIDLSGLTANADLVFNFAADAVDPTGGGVYGRVAVNVQGVGKKYLVLYS